MKCEIKEMDRLTAVQIASWQYREPYSIYSMDGSKEAISELLNGTFYSAYHDNQLLGYFCFGKAARVPAGNEVGGYDDQDYLDIGLGLKPELCGQGYGDDFIKSGLNFAIKHFSQNKFRLTVARFNQRAIKVYKRMGFKETELTFSKENKTGRLEFVIMILDHYQPANSEKN